MQMSHKTYAVTPRIAGFMEKSKACAKAFLILPVKYFDCFTTKKWIKLSYLACQMIKYIPVESNTSPGLAINPNKLSGLWFTT